MTTSMMMNLSAKDFGRSIPTNREPEVWHGFACEYFPKYEINTDTRIAGFMAQGSHESNDFVSLIENLNYSAAGLRKVFPRYFRTYAIALQYARDPVRIANRVYDDALRINKLGNIQEGDGWRFRGSGIMMLTGRDMYTRFADEIGTTPEDAAAYVRTKRGAFESACWVWKIKRGNWFSDQRDIRGMSRAINGGDIGMADRVDRWNRYTKLKYLEENLTVPEVPMLQRGAKGYVVAVIQRSLGIVDDGAYGPGTEREVRNWQAKLNYPLTGKLTPEEVTQLFPILRRGSRGKDVAAVQRGLSISDDGGFGQQTEGAVKSWQEGKGFEVTGILTPEQVQLLTVQEK